MPEVSVSCNSLKSGVLEGGFGRKMSCASGSSFWHGCELYCGGEEPEKMGSEALPMSWASKCCPVDVWITERGRREGGVW